MKFLCTIIMLLISSTTFAYQCGDTPFTSSTSQNGKKVGLYATTEDFEGAAKWSIDEGEPPLSISDAVTLVSEWANNFYPKFDSVSVRGLRLQPYSCWQVKGHWLYVFDLTPIIDGNKLHGGSYMAAVTMAGKILEPRVVVE